MNAFPPKTILVAFDFSKRSMRAWKYAESLAKRLGASLQAVYVSQWVLSPQGFLFPPVITPERRLELEKKMERLLGRPGIVRASEGDIVGEILKAARDYDAGLIVMATEGKTGLRRFALGSITESVVRVSPIPVLSLRRAAKIPRSILAPVSNQPYSMPGFHFAENLARTLRASMTVLHVREGAEGFSRLEQMISTARRLWSLRVNLKVVSGKPVERILSKAGKHDLVVIVAHKRGILRDGILGTTAEQVLRRSSRPVLCVPAIVPARRRGRKKV